MQDLLKDMLNQVLGSNLFDGIIEILTKDPLSDYNMGNLLTSVYEFMITAAVMIMFIYFLIALVEKMTSDNFTWEQVFKQMALLLAAKLIMENGLEILSLMSKLGAYLVDAIMGDRSISMSAGYSDAQISEIIESFEDKYSFAGLFKTIGDLVLMGYLLIPWALSWVMGLMVKIVCYTRLVEIYVKVCFAPIALSDFFKNGVQGNGWQFLKSFFATCLQGAVILVIAIVFSTLLSSFLKATGLDQPNSSNWFEFMGIYVATGCSAIMLMFRSQSLSKEIMGVR